MSLLGITSNKTDVTGGEIITTRLIFLAVGISTSFPAKSVIIFDSDV